MSLKCPWAINRLRVVILGAAGLGRTGFSSTAHVVGFLPSTRRTPGSANLGLFVGLNAALTLVIGASGGTGCVRVLRWGLGHVSHGEAIAQIP